MKHPVTVQEENDWLDLRKQRVDAAGVLLLAGVLCIGAGYSVGLIPGAGPAAQFVAGLVVFLAVLIVAGTFGEGD